MTGWKHIKDILKASSCILKWWQRHTMTSKR